MEETTNIEETNQVEEAIPENEGLANETTSEKEIIPEKESKWYVLRVVSGKERKVKEYLDKDIIRNGWDKIVKQIFLPVEKVYKVQNGKKVMRERNFYPGYVMIEAVSYTHLRAHETRHDLVCRLLLE